MPIPLSFIALAGVAQSAAAELKMDGERGYGLTVADLARHIITRRSFYALVLEADNIELLRGVYGEGVVEEALRLADEAAQPKQAPQTPSAQHAEEVADALGSVMGEHHPRSSSKWT